MENIKIKGLKLANMLIRKQSGIDNQCKRVECAGWFYQPKRPEVNISKKAR